MEFAEFAAHAAAIEKEPADVETIELVAVLLEDAGSDLPLVARFVQGRVVPTHDGTKLDIGPSLCYEALARAAGPNVTAAEIEERLATVGEVGAVAAELDLGGQQGLAAYGTGGSEDLTVTGVDSTLRDLAAAEGSGSTDTKVDTLFGLFSRANSQEARFLARLVLGVMRIGVGEGTVRNAIAEAFDVPTSAVERAVQVSNDFGRVAEIARSDGVDGLADVHLEVGRPVKAMLAQAGSAVDALDAWGEAAVETKFDGARVQVHYDGESVTLFSRNPEDVTAPLPEVATFVDSELDEPAILDGEVVAVDDDGSPLPFQEVLRRFRRKHDVEAVREDVSVELHTFDCLHADGEDLLDSSLVERHERLTDVVSSRVSTLTVTDDADEVAALESSALEAGHEGIMLKDPQSGYLPGKRGQHWLKRKPDVETLDLVVTGAEWGEGRRATLFGTYELSARNGEDFETIGKVATGITDEELAALHDLLEAHVRSESGTEVDLEPAVVFEVGYEEIQRSPTYASGYALRFPRFVGVRTDKEPTDADSLERIEQVRDAQS